MRLFLFHSRPLDCIAKSGHFMTSLRALEREQPWNKIDVSVSIPCILHHTALATSVCRHASRTLRDSHLPAARSRVRPAYVIEVILKRSHVRSIATRPRIPRQPLLSSTSLTCSSFGESTFHAWFRRKTCFCEKCGALAGTPKVGEMELRAKDEERAMDVC